MGKQWKQWLTLFGWLQNHCRWWLQPTRLLHPWDFPGKSTGVHDFGASQNKVSHCFHCFPIYLPWNDGTRCHDLSFLNVECAMYVKSLSRVRLFATPWTIACQAHLSMGFSRKEYWSGLPFPSPGDLPNPGTEPTSPVSPALVGGFFFSSLNFFNGSQILWDFWSSCFL